MAWTGRMRTTPYRRLYMRDRPYAADEDGIIEDVDPQDRYQLSKLGCVDA